MADAILQTVPLGMQWPTLDPFLFCAHHRDNYPQSDGELGPAASLSGRQIGQDFAEIDGWNMYHGNRVPGFPQHPHRGFETITYVRRGLIDHSDSLGATARFGRGDVQWMTAGNGIVHAEMFPLLDESNPNPLEMFQIWLNLPAADKLVDPYFTMLWDADIPKIDLGVSGPDDAASTVTVLAGRLDGLTPPTPPPDSWAARSESDLAIWHLSLQPGASWTMPAATHSESNRTIYVFEGGGLTVAAEAVEPDIGAVIDAGRSLEVIANDGPVEAMVLGGRPIGEPVAQYGPFVMNTEAEIRQAMADYQTTQFGGWPWHSDDPTHGHSHDRFARHADGQVEMVSSDHPA